MYEALLPAAISVCSVVIGMVGQHYLSRAARREDTARDKRLESYSTYVASACKLSLINKDNKTETNSARIEFVAAKAKISIYGSDEVVRALAIFEKDASFKRRESRTAFINAIEAMRADGCHITSVSDDELHWLLFSDPQQPD